MTGPPENPGQQRNKTTVLLTGCSEGGIGFALAQEYHRRGCRVIATARNPAKMARLTESGIETLLQLDVADPASIREAVRAVTDLLSTTTGGGQLDVLVNNAGGGYQAPLLDADLDEARRLFDVNVWGVLAVTQAFAPLLVASATAGRRPRVVNIGSVAGLVPVPWQGVYNASKSALAALNNTLRLEFRPLGIDVVHIVTGGIATNFVDNAAAARLPRDSLYAPLAADIEGNLEGGRVREAQGCSVETYARTVVAQTLKTNPPTSVWKGTLATIVRIGSRLGWDWVNDRIIGWMWGMGPLRAKFKAVTSKKQL
ncbi:NADPH-dependent 1-acyldihydroxyacetone phosphate reductase [Apiospora rasikravindrae]|uniref:NADPH-dependent 1-acyldihydroxyacetone phosphate reductase n=1 Tax=Apiospora rasikravindrae TaxID=990691 RepID=A0ABR1RSP6_9PEZI